MSANSKCPQCGKTVYFAERSTFEGKDYHSICLIQRQKQESSIHNKGLVLHSTFFKNIWNNLRFFSVSTASLLKIPLLFTLVVKLLLVNNNPLNVCISAIIFVTFMKSNCCSASGATPRFCSNCGASRAADAKFCAGCGTKY